MVFWPGMAFGQQYKVEVPEEFSHDKTKLGICKILANAVSWAKGEGFKCCFLIRAELRVVKGVVGTEPSLGSKVIW